MLLLLFCRESLVVLIVVIKSNLADSKLCPISWAIAASKPIFMVVRTVLSEKEMKKVDVTDNLSFSSHVVMGDLRGLRKHCICYFSH